jgi:hypothetical protein
MFLVRLALVSFLAFSFSVQSEITSLEIALETEKLKAEYYETSGRGKLTLIGCKRCEETVYEFEEAPLIFKKHQPITIEAFMQDYWNADYPTVFINLDKTKVLRISY